MRERRDGTSALVRAEWSQRIKIWLFNLDLFQQAQKVHLFLSFRSEVQTLLWISDLFSLGKRVVVPLMDRQEKGLLLSEIQNPDGPWVSNRFGILEPPHDQINPITPSSVDLFILPGLAFDRRGTRLGYGRGHYDRLLEKAPSTVKKIGVSFGFQIVPGIPQMPGDVLMDAIITESGLIPCPTG